MNTIEGYLGKSVEGKKSRIPARLDFLQSATGLFLGLFMWAHMFFVASILVSPEFMDKVSRAFEGDFIFGTPQPWVVSCIAFVVFAVFFTHALLAMRKFPINYRQWQLLRTHTKTMKHGDTTLWFVQATTGFVMFFFASFHLGIMLFFPETIGVLGEGQSSVRMLQMWPFYLILLFAVELHGGIGLYRLCVKWGWFEGKDAKASRKKLKAAKWVVSVFFLALGLITMLAYLNYIKQWF